MFVTDFCGVVGATKIEPPRHGLPAAPCFPPWELKDVLTWHGLCLAPPLWGFAL